MDISVILFCIGQLLYWVGLLIYWISYYRESKKRQEFWESLEPRYAELEESLCKSNENLHKAIKKLDKILK